MTASIESRIARSDVRQFGRFVVVGVVNTAFSYAIYAALIRFGVDYPVANLVAIALGMVFSFKTQGSLVFANPDNRRIFRFVFAWTLIYAVNVFVIARFIALGFDAYVSGALAIPVATVLSYFAQKFFVFRRRRSIAGDPD